MSGTVSDTAGDTASGPVSGAVSGAADGVEAAVEAAGRALEALVARGATVAVAESLTGGLIGATFTSVPGASRAFRGGVISYATELKQRLLGVPEDLLRREGAVHPDVAAAMATGVARLCEASYGVAVTGVAGPDPQDGKPVGTVFAAVSGPGGKVWGRPLRLQGSRERIRVETMHEAIDLLASVLKANEGEHSG